MKEYEPELGQAIFGQPSKEFECPEYLVALLEGIRTRIELAGGNEYQREFDPFGDWEDAELFNRDHKDMGFEVWPYSWSDETEQKYNFKFKDIEISWYKHLGRGMSINRKITKDEAIDLFDTCSANLHKWQHKHLNEIMALEKEDE